MDDKVIERTCDFCAKAGIHLMECGRCRATLYCGRACQKRHWVTHSNDCEIHRCGSPNDINSTWDFKDLFIGLKKTEIRELAYPKAEVYLSKGYKHSVALSLALRIPRKLCIDALRESDGTFEEDDIQSFTSLEKRELGIKEHEIRVVN